VMAILQYIPLLRRHPIRITRSPISSISTSQQFRIAKAELKYVLRIGGCVVRIGERPESST